MPDTCLNPNQANNIEESQAVSFQLNDAVTKIGRELNARRNTRFMREGDKITMSC